MFLSQICVATGLESFDQNILHFCVVYSLRARWRKEILSGWDNKKKRFVNGFNMGPLSNNVLLDGFLDWFFLLLSAYVRKTKAHFVNLGRLRREYKRLKWFLLLLNFLIGEISNLQGQTDAVVLWRWNIEAKLKLELCFQQVAGNMDTFLELCGFWRDFVYCVWTRRADC